MSRCRAKHYQTHHAMSCCNTLSVHTLLSDTLPEHIAVQCHFKVYRVSQITTSCHAPPYPPPNLHHYHFHRTRALTHAHFFQLNVHKACMVRAFQESPCDMVMGSDGGGGAACGSGAGRHSMSSVTTMTGTGTGRPSLSHTSAAREVSCRRWAVSGERWVVVCQDDLNFYFEFGVSCSVRCICVAFGLLRLVCCI